MGSDAGNIEADVHDDLDNQSPAQVFFREVAIELIYLIAAYLSPFDLAAMSCITHRLRLVCLPLAIKACAVDTKYDDVLAITDRLSPTCQWSGFLALPAIRLSLRYQRMWCLALSISGNSQGRDFRQAIKFCRSLQSVESFKLTVSHDTPFPSSEACTELPNLLHQLHRLQLTEFDLSWAHWRNYDGERRGKVQVQTVRPLDTLESMTLALYGQDLTSNSLSLRVWVKATLLSSPIKFLSIIGSASRIPSLLKNTTRYPYLNSLRISCDAVHYHYFEVLFCNLPAVTRLHLEGLAELPRDLECVNYQGCLFLEQLEVLIACPDYVRYIVSCIRMQCRNLNSLTLQLPVNYPGDDDSIGGVGGIDRALFHVANRTHVKSLGFAYCDAVLGTAPISLYNFFDAYHPLREAPRLRSMVKHPILRGIQRFTYFALRRELALYTRVPKWVTVALPNVETITIRGVDKRADESRVMEAFVDTSNRRRFSIRVL